MLTWYKQGLGGLRRKQRGDGMRRIQVVGNPFPRLKD